MSIVSLANSFINSQEWIFAKTMADIPHWYCLKQNCENLGDWDWFVRFMDEFGVIGEFCGRQYKYLYWGDYRYWMMDPTPEQCDLINRCLISDEDKRPENYPSCIKTGLDL
ncbi:MAG: hypothetical protein KBT00_03210 [Bacteroidales bacterium]|nr:hypothetical protein [Candidatus Cacconaster merdequi]